jgi:nucleotide-binding universal stress UspA family protein
MKTIIAPTDFSAQSENAALFAANLAEFYGAKLILLHTYEIVIPVADYAYPLISLAEIQNAAVYELELYKDKIQAQIKRKIDIVTVADNNSVDGGLKEICAKEKPDLVVMGLSGKSGLTRLIVGSNTIKAIHGLTYPVLVVPPKAQFVPVRRIGFACDYKQVIDTTPTGLLKKFVSDFNAELHIMNIDDTGGQITQGKVTESGYVAELLNELKPEFHSIASSDVTMGINWFAEKAKIDWLVTIPKKHKLIDKMFNRSQTNNLVYHSHIPVLCIHE